MASDNEAAARATLALALDALGRHDVAVREAARARALVQRSQNALVRLPVNIAAARVESGEAPRSGQPQATDASLPPS